MAEQETEKITATAPDAWVCLCGNQPHTSGFYPYADGHEVEPTVEAWGGRLYFCAACLRVIDQQTLEVVERPGTIVMLE